MPHDSQSGPPGCKPPGSALFSEHAWSEIARSLKLSGRELQIVRGVFDNRIEFAIAADLGISVHTVHTHLNRLFHKLKVASRVELILRIVHQLLFLTGSAGGSLPPLCRYQAGDRCPLLRRRPPNGRSSRGKGDG